MRSHTGEARRASSVPPGACNGGALTDWSVALNPNRLWSCPVASRLERCF
jgi:hypothetical protein